MIRIRDKPPVSSYPITDRIIGVVTCGVILGCLLGCLGPGQGREAHYISNEADKPIEAAVTYQRPVETVHVEELIEDTTEPELVSLGTYTLYGYCPCSKCCGKWSGGPTASGAMPQEGRTVAADWSVLPAGTEIYVEGVGWRVVEDTGAGIDGHTLDVYYDSHEAALGHGVQEAVVYARQD